MTKDGDLSAHAPRVLIVEDDTTIRQILRDLIADLGLAPIEARDSTQAQRILESSTEKFALVILDLMSPGIGGEALARQIRLTVDETDLPILLLSAADPRELTRISNELRARALRKPFDLVELEQEVLGAIRR